MEREGSIKSRGWNERIPKSTTVRDAVICFVTKNHTEAELYFSEVKGRRCVAKCQGHHFTYLWSRLCLFSFPNDAQ